MSSEKAYQGNCAVVLNISQVAYQITSQETKQTQQDTLKMWEEFEQKVIAKFDEKVTA